MNLLYGLQFFMLLSAIGLLTAPFIVNKNILSGNLLAAVLFMSVSSIGLYQLTTNKPALRFWLTQGQKHYQLEEEFNALGGIDGIIAKVQAKLKDNPTDAKGWFILGKLYLAKHDNVAAAEAFKKAQALNPSP